VDAASLLFLSRAQLLLLPRATDSFSRGTPLLQRTMPRACLLLASPAISSRPAELSLLFPWRVLLQLGFSSPLYALSSRRFSLRVPHPWLGPSSVPKLPCSRAPTLVAETPMAPGFMFARLCSFPGYRRQFPWWLPLCRALFPAHVPCRARSFPWWLSSLARSCLSQSDVNFPVRACLLTHASPSNSLVFARHEVPPAPLPSRPWRQLLDQLYPWLCSCLTPASRASSTLISLFIHGARLTLGYRCPVRPSWISRAPSSCRRSPSSLRAGRLVCRGRA
jgi:hypothetical protein